MFNCLTRTPWLVVLGMLVACSEQGGGTASGRLNEAQSSADSSVAPPAGENAKDPQLYGVWIPKTYMYGGKPYPIDDGLVIITQNYLIANAIYDLSEKKKPQPDANANYGTYVIKAPGQLVMNQAMQLHWRSEGGEEELVEGDGTFFNQDIPEEIHYEVEGDTLTFRFQVSGERSWILQRVGDETCSAGSMH